VLAKEPDADQALETELELARIEEFGIDVSDAVLELLEVDVLEIDDHRLLDVLETVLDER
jgi:hypothetical protein